MITKGKNALICYQTLSTNSLRKSMKISMENVYVDIATKGLRPTSLLGGHLVPVP